MSMTAGPDIAFPDTDALAPGDGPSFRRILVPIRLAADAAQTLAVAASMCSSTNGVLCLLHVRIYDPPLRGAGRFYPETRDEAAAVPDEALLMLWAYGLNATTAVVQAQRGEVATAIAQQAAAWRADVIVMTRRPTAAICRVLASSVPDQVMRKAHCPVLAVPPRRKVKQKPAADHIPHP
jgi:nucleotide-binding universal stress UspA family protein